MAEPKNQSEWGKATAASRYGSASGSIAAPKNEQAPQCPEDKQAPGYHNDTPDNWLRGMGPGQAEGKPNFDKSKAGR